MIPMLMGVGGLTLAAYFSKDPLVAMIGLSIATMGLLTGLPSFWPLPAAFLGSVAAAGGIALINSLGQVGGFVSPYLIGWIKDLTHSTDMALYILAGLLFVGTLLVLSIPGKTVNR